MKNTQKGFTLIELLVVVAIIGMLASVVVVSLNSARAKSRDAKRVADVRGMQNALELYFNDNNAYPTTVQGIAALVSGGYMGAAPTAPTPLDGTCTSTQNTYTYTSSATNTYSLAFCLGGATGSLSAGTKTATPSGIN